MSLAAVAAAAVSNFAGCSAPIVLTHVEKAGFSGCAVWKVAAGGEFFCLKCWPAENPPPERLPWIHQVLLSARDQGLMFVPRPLATRSGETTCELAGCIWELMTWLPGQADSAFQTSPMRLQAAFRALGQFHRSTSARRLDLWSDRQESKARRSDWKSNLRSSLIAPAIEERLHRFNELAGNGIESIVRAVRSVRIPELDDLADQWINTRRLLPAEILPRLKAAARRQFNLQPAIRDIWRDHVLFSGDEVTGLIDFGAMRSDTPLVDVSRLLGSFARDDADLRSIALRAYEEVCPLSAQDREVIELLDHVSTWIAGWNWLEWLYVERRSFPSLAAVRERLVHLLGRSAGGVR